MYITYVCVVRSSYCALPRLLVARFGDVISVWGRTLAAWVHSDRCAGRVYPQSPMPFPRVPQASPRGQLELANHRPPELAPSHDPASRMAREPQTVEGTRETMPSFLVSALKISRVGEAKRVTSEQGIHSFMRETGPVLCQMKKKN